MGEIGEDERKSLEQMHGEEPVVKETVAIVHLRRVAKVGKHQGAPTALAAVIDV